MLASTALIALLPTTVQGARAWSQPAPLAACSSAEAPSVLFPSDAPNHATGPGAIVWGSSAGCTTGAAVQISALAPGTDAPARPGSPRATTGRALALTVPVAAAAAPHGRILLAAPAPGGGLELSEGLARGPFTAVVPTGGASVPLALATAYLGDVAIVSPGPSTRAGSGSLALRVHRFYQGSFLAPIGVSGPERGLPQDLAVAMDYRSDALAIWSRADRIYARDMPGSNRSSQPQQLLARSQPGAQIAALLSDDDRAIVAWAATRAGHTNVYAELSASGVRFGRPRLLERFADPHGSGPSSPPRLVRMSSESVMLAWSGASAGHWAVRAAAVDLNGVRSISTISAPGREAVLAGLAPGPDGEAFALWSEPEDSAAGREGRALLAARGVDGYPGRTLFTTPEQIVPADTGDTGDEAALAVDPDSDRALVAWRTPTGAIEYSLRSPGRG